MRKTLMTLVALSALAGAGLATAHAAPLVGASVQTVQYYAPPVPFYGDSVQYYGDRDDWRAREWRRHEEWERRREHERREHWEHRDWR